MPAIIIHTLLGDQLLRRWKTENAPFPVHEPRLQRTFLAGCMGPDMGMFPGGEPLFSDLAHYVRSGELTRTLIHSATSDLERAFAWGWATHVLADAMIHPIINIAAGDARGSGPLTYADDPGLHLAVEIGADGDRFAQWEQLALPRQTQPESGIAEHLTRSYHTVYGPVVTAKQVRDSLAAWFRWHRFSIALAGAAAANLYGRSGGRHGFSGELRRLARLLTGLFRRQSLVHALTHPMAPSERANALIGQAIRDYPEQFRELERDHFTSLPDYNLDTGTVEEGVTYPLTARTLAEMRKRSESALSPSSHQSGNGTPHPLLEDSQRPPPQGGRWIT